MKFMTNYLLKWTTFENARAYSDHEVVRKDIISLSVAVQVGLGNESFFITTWKLSLVDMF